MGEKDNVRAEATSLLKRRNYGREQKLPVLNSWWIVT